ncbi:MAG: hypothetical protein KC877_02065 [Candidatus Kaiserbacteria bacterium]|nr:hypothetical protein [Candidatus Kaiserbacteria bacterium]MCB9816151.1 hypothetical protein [Candidatus Nomurabacteria bacterium]
MFAATYNRTTDTTNHLESKLAPTTGVCGTITTAPQTASIETTTASGVAIKNDTTTAGGIGIVKESGPTYVGLFV